jgi:hypothetical protein
MLRWRGGGIAAGRTRQEAERRISGAPIKSSKSS